MSNYPKVSLKGIKETIFVNPKEIIYALADGNYTIIHLTNKRTVKILRKLKQVDQLLSNENFIRIHRSHLINLEHLKKYDERELVEMSNGQKLSISRTCKGSFTQKFIRL